MIDRRIRAAAAGLALAALALGASPARAQSAADKDAARELFKEAAQLATKEQWDAARVRYEKSLKLYRAPMTLFSLAVAQHRTGRLVEALESYRAFMAEAVDAKTQDWRKPAKESIDELEKRVASVSLTIEPRAAPGLVVTIDGQQVPEAALDVRRLVNPGRREIVASAKGRREARLVVTLAEGEARAVRLALEPQPEAPPPPPPVVTVPREVLPGAPPPPDRPSAPRLALPIGLMAGGAAVLGVGITVGMIGVAEAKAAPTRDGPEAGRARSKMLAGDVIGGVGVAAAGAGVIVLVVQLVSAPKTGAPRGTAITPFVSGREIGVLGRF